MLALFPAPALQLSARDYMRGGALTALATPLTCTAALLNSSWAQRALAGSGPTSAALVGDLTATSSAAGQANFARLGIAAPGGTLAFLQLSCTWTTGEAFTAVTGAVLVPLLSLVLAAPLSPILPSTAAQPIFYAPAPSTSVVAVPASSLSGIGLTLPAMLTGSAIACSATPQLVAGGAAVPIVGSGGAALVSTAAAATWPQLGVQAALNTTLNASFSCALPSGEVIGCVSPPVRVPLLTVSLSAPAAVLPSASVYSATAFVAMSPPPAVTLALDGVPTAGIAYVLSCSVVVAPGAPTVQLVGTLTTTTAGGTASFSSLGASAPMGSLFQLQVSCTWISGAVLVALSAPIRVAVLTLNVTTPPSVLASASTGGASIVAMSPAPAITVSQDGALVASLGFALPCTASSGTAQLVGTTSASTTALSATASFPGLGAFAAMGSTFTFTVSCSWVSGASFSGTSSPIAVSQIVAELAVPPPAVLLPSDPSAQSAISPVPALQLKTANAATNATAALIGYSLPCSVSVVSASGGVTVAGTSQVASSASSGTALFDALSIVGSLGRPFLLSFSCQWLSGEAVTVSSAPLVTPLVRVTWLAGAAPPAYALFNTPLAGALGAAAAFTGDLVSASPLWRTDWAAVGAGAGSGALSCSLAAAQAGGSVVLAGTTSVAAAGDGSALFAGVALQPSLVPTPATAAATPPVVLTAACRLNNQQLSSVASASVAVQALSLAWLAAPPASMLPSSQSSVTPMRDLVVAVLNSTGGVLASEYTAACSLSIVASAYSVASSGNTQVLLGPVNVIPVAGVATFSGVALVSPLGASATLQVACSRKEGGTVQPVSAVVLIDTVSVAIVAANSSVPASGLVLYNTPYSLAARVMRATLNPAAGWVPVAGSQVGASASSCSLRLTPPAGGSAAGPLSLTSSGSDATAITDADGFVSLLLYATGNANATALLSVACLVADQTVSTAGLPLFRLLVDPVAVVPMPRFWLPSSSASSTAIAPVPSIVLRASSGGAPVDATGAVCAVTVVAGNGAVVNAPLLGYRLPESQTLLSANGTVLGQIATDPLQTPIPLAAVYVSSIFGAALQLRVQCVRAQGDTSGALLAPVRMVTPALAWVQQPPASLVSQQSFAASLVLLDAGAAVAAAQLPQLPQLSMDSVTVCTLAVVSNDSGVLLQNGVATAVAGAVSFSAAGLTARAGMTVAGRVTCRLGDLPVAGELNWAVSMQPCPLGTAPAGANGYSCGICGGGSYSDGGMGVRACTACPVKGAACLGGVLQLQQAYYRADRGATVDESTELHECVFAVGCVVNSSTVGDRAWNVTHRCAEGYSGVLCGVCSSDGAGGAGYARSGNACLPCWASTANLVVMALIPFAFFVLCVYIVNKKSERSSPPDTVVRILMTYVQTIGTLTAIYQAKGTPGYASAISFSQLLGGSPLSVGPVECGLRPSYTTRFAVTIVLPFIIAATCALIVLLRSLLRSACSRCAAGGGAAATAVVLLSVAPPSALTSGASALDGGGVLAPLPMRQAQGKARDQAAAPPRPSEAPAVGILRGTLRELIAPVIFVLNLGYSSIVSSAFTIFACTPEPIAGVRYLVADLTIACNTPSYVAAQIAAGAVIFAFGLGFPLLFSYVLYRKRASLAHPETFSRLGFLYDGYRTEKGLFMFESLAMLRKSGVVLLGSVVTDAYFQVSGAVVLMTLSLLLLAVLQPYKKKVSWVGVMGEVDGSVAREMKRKGASGWEGKRASGHRAGGQTGGLRRAH